MRPIVFVAFLVFSVTSISSLAFADYKCSVLDTDNNNAVIYTVSITGDDAQNMSAEIYHELSPPQSPPVLVGKYSVRSWIDDGVTYYESNEFSLVNNVRFGATVNAMFNVGIGPTGPTGITDGLCQ